MINNSNFQEAKELTELKIFRHFSFHSEDPTSLEIIKNMTQLHRKEKINAANLERGTHSDHRSSSHLQTPFTS